MWVDSVGIDRRRETPIIPVDPPAISPTLPTLLLISQFRERQDNFPLISPFSFCIRRFFRSSLFSQSECPILPYFSMGSFRFASLRSPPSADYLLIICLSQFPLHCNLCNSIFHLLLSPIFFLLSFPSLLLHIHILIRIQSFSSFGFSFISKYFGCSSVDFASSRLNFKLDSLRQSLRDTDGEVGKGKRK